MKTGTIGWMSDSAGDARKVRARWLSRVGYGMVALALAGALGIKCYDLGAATEHRVLQAEFAMMTEQEVSARRRESAAVDVQIKLEELQKAQAALAAAETGKQ